LWADGPPIDITPMNAVEFPYAAPFGFSRVRVPTQHRASRPRAIYTRNRLLNFPPRNHFAARTTNKSTLRLRRKNLC
jgi:hypothetical protein